MWSVQGQRRASQYPGFSDDPLDAFKNLATDLTQHARDFFTGSDEDFLRHVKRAAELHRTTPLLPG